MRMASAGTGEGAGKRRAHLLINYATDVWLESTDWPQMRVSRKLKWLMTAGEFESYARSHVNQMRCNRNRQA